MANKVDLKAFFHSSREERPFFNVLGVLQFSFANPFAKLLCDLQTVIPNSGRYTIAFE
jgi:hypothetical protein